MPWLPSSILIWCVLGAGAALDEGPAQRVDIQRVDLHDGERFEASTELVLKLDTRIGIGFLSKRVRYILEEQEVLAVTVLADGDAGPRRRLEYVVRRKVRTLPLVGTKTKERRVAGKSYVVEARSEGPRVTTPEGGAVRDKEVRDVLRSWEVVGRAPPLFDALPDGPLEPGTAFTVSPDTAKRLLGLPLEDLDVDTLTLRLRGRDGAEEVVFEAQAALSGSTEMGDAKVALTAALAGEIVASPSTGRLVRLALDGTVKVQRGGGGGLIDDEGSGPLSLRRSVRPLP